MRVRELHFNFVHLRVWILLLTVLLATVTPGVLMAATPTVAQSDKAQGDESEWLVMVYSDADDESIEDGVMGDMQEMELVGSSDDVTIVAQVDRYDGGYDGLGDWTTAKRFYITQDDDTESVGSEEIEDLGEVNMADGETLVDFIEWAVTNYPARKTMLIISDHGGGWPGSASDPDPGITGADDIVLAELFGDMLWLMELDRSLTQAQEDLGLDYFDVIGFDACLMSQLEVLTALAPHALYAVASEETVPYLGYAYAGFLNDLVANPQMEGDELSKNIVQSYINQDVRLEDQEYVDENLSPEAVAEGLGVDTTMTAVDLSQIENVNLALDYFSGALETLDPDIIDEARAYAQSYESVFGDEEPSPYIDLGNFSQMIQNSTDDDAVIAAATELDNAIAEAVIDEKHGPERPGSTGIAIYFPVPDLYDIADNLGYTTVAQRFTDATQWDEFLAYNVGGGERQSFERPTSSLEESIQELNPDLAPDEVEEFAALINELIDQGLAEDEIAMRLIDEYNVAEDVAYALQDAGLLAPQDESAGEEESAPAAIVSPDKPLQVSPITLSAQVARPDEPVTISADVEGERVGYLYSFIGRYLPDQNVLVIEDQDFIFSDEDQTVEGVSYPQWPDDAFSISFDWEPTVYSISDGETSIRTLFAPDTYGDDPTYSVNGIYHFSSGSPDRAATIYFQGDSATEVVGFSGNETNGVGVPKEIRPQAGDSFTVLAQGYNLDEDAEDVNYEAESGTLTFGDEPFTLETTPAPSGNYLVGIIAEDLDGNTYEQYEQLFVENEEADSEAGMAAYVNEDLAFALLQPEDWEVDDSAADSGVVVFNNADQTLFSTVMVLSYPDAEDDAAATQQALNEAVQSYADSFGAEKLEMGEPSEDYLVGGYEGQSVEFSYELDGTEYQGKAVATTPAPETSYVLIFDSTAALYEENVPLFEEMAYSFDLLLEETGGEESEATQPDFDEVAFSDDYSDPESGLYDQQEGDWGASYYDSEAENYVYELSANPGAIYDYYEEIALPDSFMVATSAQSAGSQDTAYGIIFNVQDDDHFYAFRVSGDGYFVVEKANGDEMETVVDWSSADAMDTSEGAVNYLAVAGNGGDYQLYVNGVEAGSFSDPSYIGGTAGYMVDNYDAENGATFIFDDFAVGTPAQ